MILTAILQDFIAALWSVTAALAPSLMIGLLCAGLLHLVVSPALLQRQLGGGGFTSVAKVAVLGVPLPLCSCGVIPVAESLRRHGAAPGAVIAFLVSTPQTGVDALLVTAGAFGWTLALLKALVALLLGLMAGALSLAITPKGEAMLVQPSVAEEAPPAAISRLRRFWDHAYYDVLGSLYSSLLFGVLLAAVLTVALPPWKELPGMAEGNLELSLLVMCAVAIPLYICSVSSVPVAAALVAGGAPPAAALVLLIAGPATNTAAIIAVRRMLGWRHLAIYLGVILSGSVAAAWLLADFLAGVTTALPSCAVCAPGLADQICAAALVLAGLHFSWRRLIPSVRTFLRPAATAPEVLYFSGMRCGRCADSVRRRLEAWPGVQVLEVDPNSGKVELLLPRGITPGQVEAALLELGYTRKNPAAV